MNFDAAQNSSPVVPLKSVPLLTDSLGSPPMMSVESHLPAVNISSPVTPKILNRQAPQKDPIKIVKNGRVITLPPIEAPATRGAKRRAQGDPIIPVTPPQPAVVTQNSAISTLVTSTSPVSSIKVPKVEKSDSKNSSW